MELAQVVRGSWGWTGIELAKVVAENDVGNLLVRDEAGHYWRLCPEDLYCKVVAGSRSELDQLLQDPEFESDWCMDRLVQEAIQLLGPLETGRKYCFKIPGVLGGKYGGENLSTISLVELISASGSIAEQIKDLPDGAQIRLDVGERA
jgi:hypothetical protein